MTLEMTCDRCGKGVSASAGEYKEIPYNSIVAVVATLLYVVAPIDIIPDIIPIVGFTDDAMAVAFCMKMIHDDLEKYKTWRDQKNAIE